MIPLWRRATALLRRPLTPLTPLQFPTSGFPVIPQSQLLEEEHFDEFRSGQYCPVKIGNVLASNRYQVVGKLGLGSTSTGWLARNLINHYFVSLKIFNRDHGKTCQNELPIVRTALETLSIDHPQGTHQCLVQPPMWDSWKDLLTRNPSGRFSDVLLKGGLRHLLLALDYLHSECKLVHTADNILHAIADPGILATFVQAELNMPSPRKTHLAPSRLRFPAITRNHDAQPDVYRSPEVMMQAPWSYSVDIWNVGAMIWDVFECGYLFRGRDPAPVKGYYTTRAHLAEVVGLLGLPPGDSLGRGRRSREFFDEDGKWIANVPIPTGNSLEKAEKYLTGRNKAMFLDFVGGMLTWRPEDRKTAAQLLEHPWLATWEIKD
ncbi:kinase-like domain-containing protein [Staphylotrichum tortipilum]|uniref:non-specific serine/threonine protein kinase n=1 Tax=Staphylotrichum tortipilum TaxID=2831512 RepID=A0AAN6RPT5_9PEZI|nr:kinase-like domain-containing protein [Staphylotrichum longicolle]